MPEAPDKRKRKPRLVRSSAIPLGVSLTPLQLLGFILKVVLKDRITDAEVDKICSVYYDTVKKMWRD